MARPCHSSDSETPQRATPMDSRTPGSRFRGRMCGHPRWESQPNGVQRDPVRATHSIANPRRLTDGRSNPRIGAAMAEVSIHGLVDIGVRGLRRLLEKRAGGHNLPCLTIAALRNIQLDPRLLDGMRPVDRNAFDGRDPCVGGVRHLGDARTHGPPVQNEPCRRHTIPYRTRTSLP